MVVSHGDLCICTHDQIFFVVALVLSSGFLSCMLLPVWPRPTGWPGFQCHSADGAVHQSNNRCHVRLLEEQRRDAWAARWLGSCSLINGARILQTNMCKFVLLFVVETSLQGGGPAFNAGTVLSCMESMPNRIAYCCIFIATEEDGHRFAIKSSCRCGGAAQYVLCASEIISN